MSTQQSINLQKIEKTCLNYSWLSLSRSRLSRRTAYHEVKIWSLPKDENLTTGNKILWKRGEIAPLEQFILFSTIFSIYLEFQESNYIYILLNVVVRFVFSSVLQFWYVEERISRSISESPLEFEITRVDCIPICPMNTLTSSNYPCLKQKLMVSKMFELLKLDMGRNTQRPAPVIR